MTLRLASAPAAYSLPDQTQVRAALQAEDKLNHKRGQDLDIGAARLILRDRTTGDRYIVFIDSGVLDITLMP